ncbi:MAG: DUF4249 domain-containing protein [Bacteroidales bacterium]|nr:DUF4249 domain-containing protein [Bacteroidales bacterium]
MKTRAVKISFLLIIPLIMSCKEVFYPDEIISNNHIPVIQGIVPEGKPPEVKLSWATYYEENSTSCISDALVWITDDAGNNETLEETTPGIYTDVGGGFTGVRGRTYTLHVETPSGMVYESTPERILAPPELDSMFAVPVVKTVTSLSSLGTLITTEKKGLDLNVSFGVHSDSTRFFRFKTDILTQITYILNPNSMLPTYVYEWKSSVLDKVYSVDYSFASGSRQIVPEHYAGFLEFVYNSYLSDDKSTAPYTDGWVVSMHVYAVSGNVYQYYNSIAEQLNANNQIFAPVPSQIKGNMHCTNDKYEKVIGIFEAVSEIIFYRAFSWVNPERHISKDVDDFPDDPGNGVAYNIPPYFWVRW